MDKDCSSIVNINVQTWKEGAILNRLRILDVVYLCGLFVPGVGCIRYQQSPRPKELLVAGRRFLTTSRQPVVGTY